VEEAIAGVGRTHVLQPIVDVLTGRPVGVEALARFDLPPQGPAAWFAEAEQVGLRGRLEVAAAATALADLGRRDLPGYLSVNLSPDVILGPELPLLLVDLDLTRVVLEITEHAPVEDYDLLLAVLAPHRAAGLRLAIDDAGAGFASFRHILRLAPDFIKIDLSLVRDVDHDPVRQALTRSLVGFADGIGATLIAEGVEVQAELDTLVDLGVRLMQGYLLCRPCHDPPTTGYPRPTPTASDAATR
jgi:EAL domain-containing protein (putative c-di-GMP-specific phosphodiesterase class I)